MTITSVSGRIPEWTVGDRMRKARESVGLSQREIADLVGIGRTTVGNYELGVTPPKRPLLLSWALVCKVDLEWLTGERPNEPQAGKPRGYSGSRRKLTELMQYQSLRAA